MKKNTILTQLTVTKLDKKGAAIFRIPGHDRPVVVSGGLLPGMICDVRIIKKNRRKIIGRLVVIHDMGPMADLKHVRCAHYIHPPQDIQQHRSGCGGCKRQALSYPQQLELKQKTVTKALKGIVTHMRPALPAPETRGYRNKIEYSFGNFITGRGEERTVHSDRSLGFHKQGLFGKIVDIDHCDLVDETINAIFTLMKKLLADYTVHDQVRHEGVLRHMMIRQGKNTNQIMLVLSLAQGQMAQGQYQKLKSTLTQHPELQDMITTCLIASHDGLGGVFADKDAQRDLLRGTGTIQEDLYIDGQTFSFDLSPQSFFQTNTTACESLYSTVVEMSQTLLSEQKRQTSSDHKVLVDLYCGTGTIGIIVASLLGNITHLVGVDEVASSISNAYDNAKKHALPFAYDFFAGKTEKVMTIQQGKLTLTDTDKTLSLPASDISLLIVDPPRSGLHPDAIQTLQTLKQHFPHLGICYISCNPDTLARDLDLLQTSFTAHEAQAIDMFPHTHHVETIVTLL